MLLQIHDNNVNIIVTGGTRDGKSPFFLNGCQNVLKVLEVKCFQGTEPVHMKGKSLH